MFPGQSSRYPGMLRKLCDLRAANREIVARASALLDWDLERHFDRPDADVFARNVDVQVGVFLANHLFLETIEAAGVSAEASLGLSLGEYNHLVHIGALTFDDALLTVRARGEAYDAGPRGMMVSVQPADEATVLAVVERARLRGVVEISNFNSPTQHVLAGEEAAVREAMRIFDDEHYVQTVVIERHVPMHSSLFRNVGVAFRRYLNNVEFAAPRLPYLANRTGGFVDQPTQATFVELLTEHVFAPVQWRRSIETIIDRFADVTFVEIGPLAVLHNLLSRKWVQRPKFHTDGAESLSAHLDGVITRLMATTRLTPQQAPCTTL